MQPQGNAVHEDMERVHDRVRNMLKDQPLGGCCLEGGKMSGKADEEESMAAHVANVIRMKKRIRELKEGNSRLREENSCLREENSCLQEEMEKLKASVAAFEAHGTRRAS